MTEPNRRLLSHHARETKQLGESVAKLCMPGDVVTLSGDLGAGKTCFSQGFIGHFCPNEPVQSPTFLLVKPYTNLAGQNIYHMDFYRLKHPHELHELGLEECISEGICLIEWPNIAAPLLPDTRLDITITHTHDSIREFAFFAKGDWQERLNNIHLHP